MNCAPAALRRKASQPCPTRLPLQSTYRCLWTDPHNERASPWESSVAILPTRQAPWLAERSKSASTFQDVPAPLRRSAAVALARLHHRPDLAESLVGAQSIRLVRQACVGPRFTPDRLMGPRTPKDSVSREFVPMPLRLTWRPRRAPYTHVRRAGGGWSRRAYPPCGPTLRLDRGGRTAQETALPLGACWDSSRRPHPTMSQWKPSSGHAIREYRLGDDGFCKPCMGFQLGRASDLAGDLAQPQRHAQ